jgi:hypothetical protein
MSESHFLLPIAPEFNCYRPIPPENLSTGKSLETIFPIGSRITLSVGQTDFHFTIEKHHICEPRQFVVLQIPKGKKESHLLDSLIYDSTWRGSVI